MELQANLNDDLDFAALLEDLFAEQQPTAAGALPSFEFGPSSPLLPWLQTAQSEGSSGQSEGASNNMALADTAPLADPEAFKRLSGSHSEGANNNATSISTSTPVATPAVFQFSSSGTTAGAGAIQTTATGTAASKPRRKRNYTPQQQLADLQAQLEAKTAAAKTLEMNNTWLRERMHMMEAVIEVRDRQLARVRQLQQGLGDFNPYKGIKSNPQEMRDITPSKLADKIMDATGAVAMRLANLQPLLDTNPHLFSQSAYTQVPLGQQGPGTTVASTGGWWDDPCPRQAVLPPLLDHMHARLVPELLQLIETAHHVTMAWTFMYLQEPRLLLMGSVRLQSLQDSNASWDEVASVIERMSQAGGSMSSAPLGPVPVVAPEIQWRTLVAGLRLCDLQRIRAAALWNIISAARDAINRERAELGQNMFQLMQEAAEPHLRAAVRRAPPGPERAKAAALWEEYNRWKESGGKEGAELHHTGDGDNNGGQQQGQEQEQGSSGSEQTDPVAAEPGESDTGTCKEVRPEVCAKALAYKAAHMLQREAQLVDRLQHTVVKERCLILIAMEVLFRNIFTPVQDAVTSVTCYPYMPDAMGILHAAAVEFQPDVLERLVAASRAGLRHP